MRAAFDCAAFLLLCTAPFAHSHAFPKPALDVLLQVRLSSVNSDALQDWLRRRPFAAVLPIQPMLVQALQPPQQGVDVTFRRKPSSEKGAQDGGIRIAIGHDSLLVTRISEGQYTSKAFSERALCRSIVRDLESLPAECGEVLALVDFLAGG
eukprot:CAMPEP_0119379474 /NCGR_PEP_ID=MMETSP1334-20130426/52858_1 /TAXON_ID=127549 /ORGANISM="Calcidiscus leptoporus, Strain RCC1130" /LENGTH=151 /DNA_ID=CAMNT_0007398993 /DNA_START=11 /DNA_END=466 /DNA_ORIENTATION=+